MKVSVIVPTFNRCDLLRRALDSLVAQTFRDFEVIVINDAGESVEDVLLRYSGRIRLELVTHERNQGLPAARNSGLSAARGNYIAYLDDDDEFYPDHLESLLAHMQRRGLPWVYSRAHRACEKRDRGEWSTVQVDEPHRTRYDPDVLLARNLFPVLAVMHERRCLAQVGMFDPTLPALEDWDLWIRMSRRFPIARLNKVTCRYSWRCDGSSMTSQTFPRYVATMRRINERYRHFATDKPHVLRLQKQLLEEAESRAWALVGERLREQLLDETARQDVARWFLDSCREIMGDSSLSAADDSMSALLVVVAHLAEKHAASSGELGVFRRSPLFRLNRFLASSPFVVGMARKLLRR